LVKSKVFFKKDFYSGIDKKIPHVETRGQSSTPKKTSYKTIC
jgi:hypothetical protein